MPETDLRPRFREAVDRELLIPEPDGSPGRYAFRHALTQEAILSGILADECVELHAAFAAVLDELNGDGFGGHREPGIASELAYHWSSAHDDLRAFSAHIEAGLAAEAIAAYPEAERHLRQAVEIHDRRPADRLPPGVDLVDILRRMARCASLGGAPSRAVESQQRALELVDPVMDPTLAGLLRAAQARYVSQVAPASEVLDLARDAVRLVPDEPPSDARAFVLAVLAGSLVVMAHYEEALDVSELAIVAARRAGNASAEVGVLLSRTVAMGFFAETDEALAAGSRALEIALQVGDPVQIGRAYWNLGYMQAMTGRRWADAIATCLEGVAASERNGLLFENGGGRDLLGSAAYSAWASGRWALADELLDRARDLGAEESETTLGFLYADVRALLALARGELDAAARWIDELRRITGNDNADPAVVSELGRVPAQLALDQGRPEEASEIVRRTISSLDAIGATLDADDIGETLGVGTRVEADVAMAARARRDPVAVDTALARARGYVERLRTLHGDFARTRPGRARVSAAFLRSAEAELARLTREPADWPGVADRWTDLDEPLRVAYAWFRDAEAILATSRRRMAAAASLRRAREIAERLGAIVLLRQIDVLAVRGRIPEIGKRPDPTPGNGTGAASIGSRLGLTKREREVLALLADGRTNREIGERLFITEKSAGVHVSNILGKVGAARRTEAVAIARRAGIV
jgi:DNA-binding CsgD family transcriptional regulator/tetratricopeptide (TPR) repeat protein